MGEYVKKKKQAAKGKKKKSEARDRLTKDEISINYMVQLELSVISLY